MQNVREIFGDIDIYLFDQLQKSRFSTGMKILDAGCGGGRNVIYLMRMGCKVFAVDRNAEAVKQVKNLAQTLSPDLPPENFQIAAIEKLPFPAQHFDRVISSAVLHFAENKSHFDRMLTEMWRVLKPGGMLFARLASSIGIENLVIPIGNGRYQLPDGSERFLVNEDFLMTATEKLGGQLLEPVKTTNVQNLRCMTTWVLSKTQTRAA